MKCERLLFYTSLPVYHSKFRFSLAKNKNVETMVDLPDLSTEDFLDDHSSAKTSKRSSKSIFPPPSPNFSNESNQYSALNIRKFLKEQPDKCFGR